MATWYVRPLGGSYGAEDGTTYATAYNGFAGITWGVSGVDTGDTLYICGTHVEQLTIGQADAIIRGDYVTEAGIINAEDTRDYCIFSRAIDGAIYSVTCSNAVENNIYVDSNGASVTSFIVDGCTVSGAGRAVIQSPYTTTTGTGILFTNNNLDNQIHGIVVNNCTATRNGKHGIDLRGNCKGTVSNCITEYNGFTDTGHGIHTFPPQLGLGTTGWTNTAGDVWQHSVAAAYTVSRLRWRVALYRYKMTNIGASSTPAYLQFGQVGQTLYVNIGTDPNGDEFYTSVNDMGPINIIDCESRYNHNINLVEGHGIGVDDMSENVHVKRCYCHHNDGNGMTHNNTDNCTVESSFFVLNGDDDSTYRNGVVLYGSCVNSEIYNNTFLGNKDDGIFSPVSTGMIAKNNLLIGHVNGIRDVNADTGTTSTTPTITNNLSFGGSTDEFDIQTPSATNIETDPALYLGVYPHKASTAMTAGLSSAKPILDYFGKRFTSPQVVGAVSLGANIPTNSRVAAASRTAATARTTTTTRTTKTVKSLIPDYT